MLFRLEDKLWLKLDNKAAEVSTASCFADAVELLLACFFVFNVEYAYHLKPAFEVLEYLMKIKQSPHSAVAREFTRDWKL